ncbi:MAG: hypothetical protein LBK60_03175 [Verrucomicrobiales bacterium]|nr:hypothetical protein [Verrucomicrobiales bacterium]
MKNAINEKIKKAKSNFIEIRINFTEGEKKGEICMDITDMKSGLRIFKIPSIAVNKIGQEIISTYYIQI